MLETFFKNSKELPKPVGKYIVGITQLDFVDRSRKKVFPFEEEDAFREIPVKIFYPAENNENKNSASYSSVEVLEVLNRTTFGLFSKNAAKVKTNCYENVPILLTEDRHPVIIFNHGYCTYTMQNTILCSDLASSGYIVVSVGRPYEASGVQYLDGRIIKMPKTTQKNLRSIRSLKALQIYFKASTKEYYSDSKAMEASEYLFLKLAKNLTDNVKIWVEDNLFVADRLSDLNEGKIESIFKNKLKLDLGIGITGHSYGGTAAGQTCFKDKRFVAGINIDGGTFGDYLYQDIKTPFMLLGTDLMKNISRTTYIYNTEDTYMVILDNTGHWGYCDALFISRQANLTNLIGKREKYQFREIVTNYHLKFFEKYLLGNREIELEDIKYNGVQFSHKIKQKQTR